MNEALTRREYERLTTGDALTRAHRAHDALSATNVRVKRLQSLRAQAVLQLIADGWTLDRIGKELGIKRQTVHQIAHSVNVATPNGDKTPH